MPTVEKANTQISAKPKRDPATAANTSSLMSTKPPTAVMMPSVISISPAMLAFHCEQLVHNHDQSSAVIGSGCCKGRLDQTLELRCFGFVQFLLKLVAAFFLH